jgi:hypothetical protein
MNVPDEDQQEKDKQREEAKKLAEKEAVKKINEATLAGIKAGEEASKKLHENAKV